MEMGQKKVVICIFWGALIAGICLSFSIVTAGDSVNKLSKEEMLMDAYRTQPIQLNDGNIQYDCVEDDGILKSKWYESTKKLEEQMNFKVLYSRYFSDSNSKIVYIKDAGFLDIYRVPEKVNNKDNVYAFFEKLDNRPFLKMTIITDAQEKGSPTEYLGYYRIKEPFKTESGTNVNLIEEYNEQPGNERYVIIFKNNDIVYTVENLVSIDLAKKVANSFFEQ